MKVKEIREMVRKLYEINDGIIIDVIENDKTLLCDLNANEFKVDFIYNFSRDEGKIYVHVSRETLDHYELKRVDIIFHKIKGEIEGVINGERKINTFKKSVMSYLKEAQEIIKKL